MSDTSTPDLSRLRIQRDEPTRSSGRPRRRRRSWAPLVLLALLVGAGYLFWPRLAPLIASWRAVEVKTATVVRTRPGAELELTTASGYVVPRITAALAATVAGELVKLEVDVGDTVVKDALIAQIDPEAWEHVRDQRVADRDQARWAKVLAEQQVATAQKGMERLQRERDQAVANVAEVDSRMVEAERVLQLNQRLANSGAGLSDDLNRSTNELLAWQAAKVRASAGVAVLETRLEEAALEIAEKRTAVEQAKARLQRAEADLAAANTDLDRTRIEAPFAGVILRKEAELGEIVVPALAGGATSRGAVVTMADFGSLEMEVDVFERDIRLVKPQSPTHILINAFPDLTLPGRIRQIVPTADRTKGTVQVKVAFERMDPRVLPEMAGKVVFLDPEKPTVERPPAQVIAPTAAVVSRDGKDGVFLVEGDTVRFQPIQPGDRQGASVTVMAGLEGGERVVLSPSSTLTTGTRIRIQEPQDG